MVAVTAKMVYILLLLAEEEQCWGDVCAVCVHHTAQSHQLDLQADVQRLHWVRERPHADERDARPRDGAHLRQGPEQWARSTEESRTGHTDTQMQAYALPWASNVVLYI